MTDKSLKSLPYRLNVGIVLTNSDGKIFAGKRIKGPGDAWQMPQGGIDKGEDPLQAAFRELEEETGVKKSDVDFVSQTSDWLSYDLPDEIARTIWGGKYRGQKQKWFLFKFNGEDAQINIAAKDAEFSEWKWLYPKELIDCIVPFKKEVYRDVFLELLQYR